MTTGAAFFTHTDAVVGDLVFARTFNSRRVGHSVYGRPHYGAFGPGWNASFEARLDTIDARIVHARNSVKIWDARTHQERGTLGGVSEGFGFVRSIAFHAGSRIVVFGDWFGSVRVWNHDSGGVRLLGHCGRAIYDMAFSPDGRLLASAGHDRQLRLWDLATGSQLHAFQGHTGPVTPVSFSPDGHLLASGSDDRTIRLWNVTERRNERTLVGHAKSVNSISFSPDGRHIASVSADETLKFWKIR